MIKKNAEIMEKSAANFKKIYYDFKFGKKDSVLGLDNLRDSPSQSKAKDEKAVDIKSRELNVDGDPERDFIRI